MHDLKESTFSSNTKLFISVLAISIILTLCSVYFGYQAMQKNREETTQILKQQGCVLTEKIQANSIFSDQQFKYTCKNGMSYTINSQLLP